MKLHSLLVIGFLCLSRVSFSGGFPLFQDCNKIDVAVEVENTVNGQDNGKVKVNMTKGDTKTVKYIFCEETGRVLNEAQFKNNSLANLKKGTYYCIVSTVDCYKKLRFTIE